MSIFKVRFRKSSSDWQVARNVFEEELKAIDEALNIPLRKRRVPTTDEFVSHILDVHRMWCEACPPPGGRGVRPDAASVDASATAEFLQKRKKYVTVSTQTTYGGNDRCLIDSQDILDDDIADDDDDYVDEDVDEDNDDVSETSFPLSLTYLGDDKEPQIDADKSKESSSSERVVGANLIKEEVLDDDLHADQWTHQGIQEEDHESIRVEENDERDEDVSGGWLEDAGPSSSQDNVPQTHKHDVQFHLKRIHHFSDLPIKQKKHSSDHCDVDKDSIRNESASHQRHEEITSNRSDVKFHFSDLPIKQEKHSSDHCDVDMNSSRTDSASHQRLHDRILLDEGRTLLNSSGPSSSTHNDDVCGCSDDVNSLELCHGGTDSSMNAQNSSRSDGMKPYQCLTCSMEFCCKSALYTHLRTHSDPRIHCGLIAQSESGSESYQCSECKQLHTRMNTVDKLHLSSSNNKIFTHKSDLSNHLWPLFEEKCFPCSICSKVFPSNDNLSCHMRTHRIEKPYQCEICSRRYKSKYDMNRHMKRHTDETEKSYQSVIGYKKIELSRHALSHSEENDFQCSICNKTFARKAHLFNHMRTHIGE